MKDFDFEYVYKNKSKSFYLSINEMMPFYTSYGMGKWTATFKVDPTISFRVGIGQLLLLNFMGIEFSMMKVWSDNTFLSIGFWKYKKLPLRYWVRISRSKAYD